MEVGKSINEQLNISMFSDGMKGGWEQEHVHKSVENKQVLIVAPAKEDNPISVLNR
jgi:hypothetical protein